MFEAGLCVIRGRTTGARIAEFQLSIAVSEEQMIANLKGQDAVMAAAEVCCRHGVSSATDHNWE